jgi:hypothetical protein
MQRQRDEMRISGLRDGGGSVISHLCQRSLQRRDEIQRQRSEKRCTSSLPSDLCLRISEGRWEEMVHRAEIRDGLISLWRRCHLCRDEISSKGRWETRFSSFGEIAKGLQRRDAHRISSLAPLHLISAFGSLASLEMRCREEMQRPEKRCGRAFASHLWSLMLRISYATHIWSLPLNLWFLRSKASPSHLCLWVSSPSPFEADLISRDAFEGWDATEMRRDGRCQRSKGRDEMPSLLCRDDRCFKGREEMRPKGRDQRRDAKASPISASKAEKRWDPKASPISSHLCGISSFKGISGDEICRDERWRWDPKAEMRWRWDGDEMP